MPVKNCCTFRVVSAPSAATSTACLSRHSVTSREQSVRSRSESLKQCQLFAASRASTRVRRCFLARSRLESRAVSFQRGAYTESDSEIGIDEMAEHFPENSTYPPRAERTTARGSCHQKAARTVSMAARYSSMTSRDSISITSCLFKVMRGSVHAAPAFTRVPVTSPWVFGPLRSPVAQPAHDQGHVLPAEPEVVIEYLVHRDLSPTINYEVPDVIKY